MIYDHSTDYNDLLSVDLDCKLEQKLENRMLNTQRDGLKEGFFFLNLASSLHTSSDLFPGAAYNRKGLHKKTFTTVSSSLFHTQQS